VLVDGPVGVGPAASQADGGLIDRPPSTDTMTMRARRVFIERGEALDPVEDHRGVDLDAPCGQEFHEVGVR